MKSVFVLALVVLAAVHAEETYNTDNDNLDIEAIVSNVETLKGLNDCFLGTGPCDTAGEDFKKDINDALATSCAKCTQAQKHIIKRFVDSLKEKLPQGYEALKQKYDPENKYFANMAKVIADA